MRIFGFTSHPEMLQNAAPVMPVQPTFQSLSAKELASLGEMKLSGTLQQDTFERSRPVETSPFIPESRALWQITSMTPAALRAHIAQKMSSGNTEDLYHAASWLSAAQQHDKILYTTRADSQVQFGKYLREGIEALKAGDPPLAAVFLQRARRQILDFKDLRPLAVESQPMPAQNPFKLHY
ncbi:MAG TPA: hypothetical protein V6C99_07245 [Oculatellaceae cyanobacterium]|jgi:hypothetical protein